MKKAIAGVLLACAMSCAAETVSFSVPVLTVKSDGRTVVAGSGELQKCPFAFLETTNATPVGVSIMEDVPFGAESAKCCKTIAGRSVRVSGEAMLVQRCAHALS